MILYGCLLGILHECLFVYTLTICAAADAVGDIQKTGLQVRQGAAPEWQWRVNLLCFVATRFDITMLWNICRSAVGYLGRGINAKSS